MKATELAAQGIVGVKSRLLKTPSRSNPAQASLQTCQNCRRNAPIHWILVFAKKVGSLVGSHVCNQALWHCLPQVQNRRGREPSRAQSHQVLPTVTRTPLLCR